MTPPPNRRPRRTLRPTRRLAANTDWSDRCAWLFEDLWRPARSMVSRAYGKAFTEEEIRDVYSAAWTATLAALRTRGDSMSDDELRSYVLTAVASHASKEMRRRTRKPAGSLDDVQEGVIADAAQLLPDEAAIGGEAGGIARDLLTSLPPRRRAVMLLRYGWGLRPEEVRTLISGLSARAYRKEVTRGVSELIERLEQVETGEWCKSREPLLRDYVAGTASDAVELQVTEHLRHCRGCRDLVADLRTNLHDIAAAGAALASIGALAPSAGVGRMVEAWSGVRDAIADKVDQLALLGSYVGSPGGLRGSGTVGAGVLAKLAGAGGGGKAAVACLGVTAAAGACAATGVIPSLPLRDAFPETRRGAPESNPVRSPAKAAVDPPMVALREADPTTGGDQPSPPSPETAGSSPQPTKPAESRPAPSTPIPVPSAQQEFDPVAAPATAPAPAPEPAAPPQSDAPAVSGSNGSAAIAAEEFGP